MSEPILKIKRNVYFWEDHNFTKLRESTVGRKGLSLFELKDMDIPIPDFFVISSSVFDRVVSNTLQRDAQHLLEKGKNPDEDAVTKSLLCNIQILPPDISHSRFWALRNLLSTIKDIFAISLRYLSSIFCL